MKKILSVGDIHGKPVWKNIDSSKYDLIIIIGDLYDAFEYTADEIHTNALELVQWAKQSANVKIIIGNHDAHYFKWQTPIFSKIRGAGFNEKQLHRAFHLYYDNQDLFQVAYQYGNYLWTHAGLSEISYNFHYKRKVEDIQSTFKEVNNLGKALNKLWDLNDLSLFIAPLSRGGNDSFGGPIWADRSDTIGGPLSGYHQIVGHSHCHDIIHKEINDETSITYIDCLNFAIGKFYEINI